MTTINQDTLRDPWRLVRGTILKRRDDVADNDLDQIQKRTEEFAGILQEKYGDASSKAQQQIENVVDTLDQSRAKWTRSIVDPLKSRLTGASRSPLVIMPALLFVGAAIALLRRRKATHL